MSAQPGWYPDPAGVPDRLRFWDGQAWSAATTSNPATPFPDPGLGRRPAAPTAPGSGGQSGYWSGVQQTTSPGRAGFGHAGFSSSQPTAYANYQAVEQSAQSRRSRVGWWVAAGTLLVVVVVIAAFAVRAVNTGGILGGGDPGGQPSQDVCPNRSSVPISPKPDPADGRVHGGPVSYPELGQPWSTPFLEDRVPFGSDAKEQIVEDQNNYDGKGSNWVASILVAELMAGDGFFTPQQGAQIVVRCILGTFYGDAAVTSNEKVNKAVTIDGHDAWLIESQLSFDIPGLKANGELLIVAVIAAGPASGLYYASIPNTKPELVKPARDALKQLKVDS